MEMNHVRELLRGAAEGSCGAALLVVAQWCEVSLKVLWRSGVIL